MPVKKSFIIIEEEEEDKNELGSNVEGR